MPLSALALVLELILASHTAAAHEHHPDWLLSVELPPPPPPPPELDWSELARRYGPVALVGTLSGGVLVLALRMLWGLLRGDAGGRGAQGNRKKRD